VIAVMAQRFAHLRRISQRCIDLALQLRDSGL
jgi:hypothetical protein